MKQSEKALRILAKIRDVLQTEEHGLDNPEAKLRISKLIPVLRMHTSGFSQENYIREQLSKLQQYKEYLFGSGKAIFWMGIEDCKLDMEMCCWKIEHSIALHAKNREGAHFIPKPPRRP